MGRFVIGSFGDGMFSDGTFCMGTFFNRSVSQDFLNKFFPYWLPINRHTAMPYCMLNIGIQS